MSDPSHETRGFSLIEVLVALVIAVIAILGLAHTFGAGRGLINRYDTAREALAAQISPSSSCNGVAPSFSTFASSMNDL